MFVEDARKGWNIGVNSIISNVIMAYCLIQFMEVTGVLAVFSNIFKSVMGIFGLPGEALMVNFAAIMSMGGAVGVTVSLIDKGLLNHTHVTILLPAIFIGGGWVQYLGRILGTAGAPTRFWPWLVGVCLVNAVVVMLIMRMIA
jgi:spore maturation protein SpmB